MPWMIVRMRAGGTADSRLSHRMRDPKQYAHPIPLLVPYHAALNRAFAVASPPPPPNPFLLAMTEFPCRIALWGLYFKIFGIL